MAPRKNYTPEQMANAVAAVQGSGESVSSAAQRFGVPRITLHNKLSGKSPMVCNMGPSTILSKTEEELLVKWVLALAEKRFPITKEHLLDSVQHIITDEQRSTPFTGNRPGKKWYASFLKRHPELAERTAENLSSGRNDVTEDQILNWFGEVEEYLNQKDLTEILSTPQRIFNADESAFFLAPKPGRVLVKRGEKHVYAASGDEKENLTVLITGNAAGNLAPPMVVFAYERIPANIANSVPEDWGIGKSESGWMNSETFFEYMTTIFNPWLIEQDIQKPILFFLDGHKSHLTFHLSDFCCENGIEVIALYPNSTHILQPMDIAVFRPLKVYFRKEVVQWKLENAGNKLKKDNFGPVFKKALNRVTSETVKNGFRGAGLYPFGPAYVDLSKIKTRNPKGSEERDQERKRFQSYLESQIVSIFGRSKLDMFNKLYYEGRNVLENMALDEDLNLYVLWAHSNQITLSNVTTTSTQELSQHGLSTSSTTAIDTGHTSMNQRGTTHGTVIPEEEVLEQVPVGESVHILQDSFSMTSEHNLKAKDSGQALDKYDSDDSVTILHENILIEKDSILNVIAGLTTNKELEERNIFDDTNNIHQGDLAISTTQVHTPKVSDIKTSSINLDSNVNIVHISPKPSTSRQEPFAIIAQDITSPHHNKSGCTPDKNTLSSALNVIVPSPFKRCLFWPDSVSTKKKRSKDKVPSAVTGKAWREYHVKKEEEKKRALEEKESRAKNRLEKKLMKEKMAKEKKSKIRAKKKKVCPVLSSSEDTDLEMKFNESGESELDDQSDSNMYGDDIMVKESRPEKKKIKYEDKQKKDIRKGCYVIIRYEGEYFPGIIENKDKGQFEISTMALSTGNTFRWPDRPDKIWYKISDIVELISPPTKHNNRGYFKVPEMDKFLPDIYMS